MRSRRLLLAALVVGALGMSEARAHFLFIYVGPLAEGGRTGEVFFSEQADAGDPKFVAKIAHTKLWAQVAPGEFRPVAVAAEADRLRAALPAARSVAVLGVCEYGVLARPNQTPFLLRYYPKAMAGRPEELNRLRSRAEIPFEIMATVEGDHLQFVVLRDGKPVPRAVLETVDIDLKNQKLTADGEGKVSWSPPSPSRYSVYTRQDLKTPGEAGGKHFDEIREFATLAFDWPLQRTEADSEAVALFETAVAARAQWKGFPGFSAAVEGTMDSHAFSGTARIDASGAVTLEGLGASAKPWVEDQLTSIVTHRIASPRPASKPVLRFADEREDHPLGRLLEFDGGRFASSYRIKDGQIRVVNRLVGRDAMTIIMLDNERTSEGTLLPRSYVVQYWDAATTTLRQTETIQDRWTRVGSWDLPMAHTVTAASGAGLFTRSFTLSDHKLIRK